MGGKEGNSRTQTCSFDALSDGRNQLKANYLMSVETSKGLLNEIGSESLVSGTHTSPSAAAQKIDSVATADVVNVSMCQYYRCSLITVSGFLWKTDAHFCVFINTRIYYL